MDISYIVTAWVVFFFIGSLFGGLLLWPLAKGIGRIPRAGYLNSTLVCLISTILYLGVGYLIIETSGKNILEVGFVGMLIMNVLILSASYITTGKFIWKCSWLQSLKANIIWIVLYSLLIGYLYKQFTNLIQ
jgi:hypothetical protein